MTPWYAKGLRFSCQGCHACCESRGEYTCVYVDDDELIEIAAHMGLTTRNFHKKYCTRLHGERVLKFNHKECPLHTGDGCLVHPVRPTQCRTWPFWPDNLESRSYWRKNVMSICPGAGKGRLWTVEEIDAQAALMAAADGEEWPLA